MRWVGYGREGYRPVLGTMADGHQGSAPSYAAGAHAQGAGALAGNLVVGPRSDGGNHGGGAGAGPAYYRTMGVGLWPRRGDRASYYSAVCLETGEVEWMELEGNGNAGTSEAFLAQLRWRHAGRLNVIWDNAPAHRGEAMREYLRTPGLNLRLMNLPAYSPDFNADEAIWGWAGEEATGNLCLGSKAAVQERVNSFLAGLDSRK